MRTRDDVQPVEAGPRPDALRILEAIHDFLPDHRAGSEIYTWHLSRALRARGHDVRLLFTEKRPDRPQFEIRRGSYENLPFHEVVYNRSFHDIADLYDDPRMEQPLAAVLDEVRPDVVHVQSLVYLGLPLLRVAAARGVPVVMTLHEYFLVCPRGGILLDLDGKLCDPVRLDACARCMAPFPIERARYGDGPGAGHDGLGELRFFARAVERRTRRMLDGVGSVAAFVAPSRFLRDRLVRDGLDPRRVIVSDYGFPAPDAAPPSRAPARLSAAGPLRLGYLGTIADYKGVHVLVEAFARLPRGIATLEVRGALDWFPDFAGPLAARAQDVPGLSFPGPLGLGAAGAFLANLDALVVPSLWFENSPLTIHEAFQLGVPVITSDLGGMAELVAHGGGLTFPRGDAEELARVLRRLHDEAGLLEALRRSIPRVKAIGQDAAEMEALFRQVRRGGTRGSP